MRSWVHGLACVATATAFAPAPLLAPGPSVSISLRAARGGASAMDMQAADGAGKSRRAFLTLAAAGAVLPKSASASVFFDTERYGDKELKVSLLNKIKQQFRALYEKKPELLVPMFKIAVADALTVQAMSTRKYSCH